MNSKPVYVILVARDSLQQPSFVYELNHVPLGAPFEWCDEDELEQVLHTRTTLKPQFNYQIRYVTD